MAVYKAIKANMIPTTWEHDAVYYIKTGDYAETYVTDSNGIPYPVGNSGMINALIAAAGGAGIANIVIGETPAGALNGSNATFTALFDFIPETVEVFLNGLFQKKIDDFNTSGNDTIQMVSSPGSTEHLLLNYKKLN